MTIHHHPAVSATGYLFADECIPACYCLHRNPLVHFADFLFHENTEEERNEVRSLQ